MYVSHLSLTDFRSYPSLELQLQPGQNIFVGENGEGKTNIIESLMYLALLSSHRISSDQPLVRLGSERAYIRAKIESSERTTLVELEINASKANRAKVNQNPVRSQKELADFGIRDGFGRGKGWRVWDCFAGWAFGPDWMKEETRSR